MLFFNNKIPICPWEQSFDAYLKWNWLAHCVAWLGCINLCLSLTAIKAPRQVSNIGPFETKKQNPDISCSLLPNHFYHFHSLRPLWLVYATFHRGRRRPGLWPQQLSVLYNAPSTRNIQDTQNHPKKKPKIERTYALGNAILTTIFTTNLNC